MFYDKRRSCKRTAGFTLVEITIAILLFGYGAATPEQAGTMGLIVSVFMIGLLPFTLFYVLLRGYYALEDTRTPFFITVVFSILLLALAFPLFEYGRDGGVQVAMLALSYSLSYWIGFVIAWVLLARRLGSLDSGRTAWMLARVLVAGVLAGVAMLGIYLWILTNQVNEPDVGWQARRWVRPTVRLSWQGRSATHAGLGGGFGLVFDW